MQTLACAYFLALVSRFYDTATNVQDYADQLAKNPETYVGVGKGGNEMVYQSRAYSAVHKAGF